MEMSWDRVTGVAGCRVQEVLTLAGFRPIGVAAVKVSYWSPSDFASTPGYVPAPPGRGLSRGRAAHVQRASGPWLGRRRPVPGSSPLGGEASESLCC